MTGPSFRKALLFSWIVLFACAAAVFLFGIRAEQKAPKIKAWPMPKHMRDFLTIMIRDLEKQVSMKVEGFKEELRENDKRFRDMPADAVYDFELGVFVEKKDLDALRESVKSQLEKKLPAGKEKGKKGGDGDGD
jgi:hypothetical protein